MISAAISLTITVQTYYVKQFKLGILSVIHAALNNELVLKVSVWNVWHWKYHLKIWLYFNFTCVLAFRALLTSSMWLEWTRCLRAHRACCITRCWVCVRASKAAPASVAVWEPVFLLGFQCIINIYITTATWTLKRQDKLFYYLFLYQFVSA